MSDKGMVEDMDAARLKARAGTSNGLMIEGYKADIKRLERARSKAVYVRDRIGQRTEGWKYDQEIREIDVNIAELEFEIIQLGGKVE